LVRFNLHRRFCSVGYISVILSVGSLAMSNPIPREGRHTILAVVIGFLLAAMFAGWLVLESGGLP
jgi:hypothetical protein